MSDIVRIALPLTVWLASFTAIYGLHGIACAAGWSSPDAAGFSLARAVLTAGWITAIALQGGLVLALNSDRFGSDSKFVRRVSGVLALAALLASVWTLFPVLATSTCI